MENKTDAALQLLSELSPNELVANPENLALLGFGQNSNWQVIVKYNGDIEAVARQEGGVAQRLNDQFAILAIPPERVMNLINYTEVEYVEAPKRLVYNLDTSMSASCITTVQNDPPYRLRGSGVLLAIIDSGINYFHPDFRNADGTTRITSIWDQTITGRPPEGFLQGTEYGEDEINAALNAGSRAQGLLIVPSQDTNGHGTHVAGIAGGNGRASNGRYVGAAPEAEFIIVKLGQPDYGGFVRNIEIMLAVKYVLERARALNRPVAINISIGTNTGPHDGTSLLELYLDDAATVWKNNIVVGTGNEGILRSHTAGNVTENGTTSFEFQVGENNPSYSLSLWQNPIDRLAVEVVSPTGERTPLIVYAEGPVNFALGNTRVYATFSGPTPMSGNIEFALALVPIQGSSVTSGPWSLIVHGQEVVNGQFDVWSTITEQQEASNYFLAPVTEGTLTTPATAQSVISVAAYNDVTGQIAPFSGRGYARNEYRIKPDLAAPGVDITSASHTTSGYRTLSGTSMATPHVTGGCALLMEWGIVQENNPFLYGENLRTYLIRGARRERNRPYPNEVWGYGELCISQSLDILRQQLVL